MNKDKNIQTFLNLPTQIVSKFLKFCYFMVALVLMSCGNSNPIKINNESKLKNLNFEFRTIKF